MTLTNAQRQSRFRQRRAFMENVAPRDVLLKACTARAIATARGDFVQADDVASEAWEHLHEVPVFLRAASSPATMASAGDLVQGAVGAMSSPARPAFFTEAPPIAPNALEVPAHA